jgi:hypothetical protein
MYYNKVIGGNMARKFKNNQLSKVKAALREQNVNEVDEVLRENEEVQEKPLSKEDVKKAFKASTTPDEQKPTTKSQMRKVRKNLKKQKLAPQKTISWQHEIGDLVKIPSDIRLRPSVREKLDEDSFGIIVKMTEGDNETKLHDSQSLVFSPSGRNWHYTKTLKKV